MNSSVRDYTQVHNDFFRRLSPGFVMVVVSVFERLFAAARQECVANNEPHLVLMATQRLLAKVPQWTNQQQVEVLAAARRSTEHFDDLILACVQSHARIYQECYGQSASISSSDVTPKGFVHAVLVHSARGFYVQPQKLADDRHPSIRRENRAASRRIVVEAIRTAILQYMPMQRIVSKMPPHPITGVVRPTRPHEAVYGDAEEVVEEEDDEGVIEGEDAVEDGDAVEDAVEDATEDEDAVEDATEDVVEEDAGDEYAESPENPFRAIR